VETRKGQGRIVNFVTLFLQINCRDEQSNIHEPPGSAPTVGRSDQRPVRTNHVLGRAACSTHVAIGNASFHPNGRSAPYFAKLPNLPPTPSKQYEAEFIRSLSCISPVDSPGLPPLAYRHNLEGLWQDKCLYLDYSAYQSALLGNIRSIYDRGFGEKQEMFLQGL
jgi:hypothetical protein